MGAGQRRAAGRRHALVVDGLPVLRLVSLLAGGAMVGFGLSAVALDPGARTSLTRSGRADLAVASVSAFVLAGASLLFAVFTLADVLGIGLADLTGPGIVSTYLWDVEVSRAFLISAALALAVGVGFAVVRSLGGGGRLARGRRSWRWASPRSRGTLPGSAGTRWR